MGAQTGRGQAAASQLRTELEAAAAAAPDGPLSQVRLAGLERDPDRRLQRAEALVQRFPETADARVFLAHVLRDGGGPVVGRHAATVAAVTAAPNNVDALTAYAIEEPRRGNGDGGLQSVARAAQQALDLLPDNPLPSHVRILLEERNRIGRAWGALPDP